MEPGEEVSDAAPREAATARRWKTAVAAAAARAASGSSANSAESFKGDRHLNVPSIIENRRNSTAPVVAPAAPKLAVMVHRVTGLPPGSKTTTTSSSSSTASEALLSQSRTSMSSQFGDPPLYVSASVHQPSHLPAPHNKQRTHTTRKQGSAAAWHCLLTLSPSHPSEQVLTIALKHKLPLLNKTVVWGVASLQLSQVLEQPGFWGERQQLQLQGHRATGQQFMLEVQLFLSAERLQGPLSVLCATWNVGNACPPPPEQLGAWLQVSGSQHHLVAVAAQECNYSKDARRAASMTKRTGMSSSNGRGAATPPLAAAGESGTPRAAMISPPPDGAQPSAAAAGGGAASAASAAGAGAAAAASDADEVATAASVVGTSKATFGSELTADVFGSSSDVAVSESDFAGNNSQQQPSPAAAGSTAGGSLHGSTAAAAAAAAAAASSAGGGHEPGVQHSAESKATKDKLKGLWEQVDSALAWERLITATLGPKYWLVESKHMYQTRMLLFARMDVVPAISSITSGFEATGIGRIGMNKGGVGVSLKVDDTHIALISSHLAAHQSKAAQRNADVAEITCNLHLSGGAATGSDLTTGYHHLIWMGDLNYRLEYGEQAVTQADSPTPSDFAALCAEISAGRFQQLQELDQLQREQKAGRVFAGFREGQIDFAPTFKVEKGDPDFTYAPKRSPAWCDRVLVKSALPHKTASFEQYYTVPQICSSDHKPVGAVVSLPLATDTVTSGHVSGRTPFKLYIASVKLVDQESWRQLAALLDDAQQQRRPRLQLVVSGACMAGVRHEHVMKLKTEAASAGIAAAVGTTGGSGTGPDNGNSGSSSSNSALKASLLLHEENMPLLPGAIEDLRDDWLLMRLVLVEGLSKRTRTLARAVVPLQPAVAEYTARTFKPVPVTVQLENQAASAGRLSVQLQLISSLTARQGMYEAIRRMRALAMARSHSLNAAGASAAVAGQNRVHSQQARSSSGSKMPDWLTKMSLWPKMTGSSDT